MGIVRNFGCSLAVGAYLAGAVAAPVLAASPTLTWQDNSDNEQGFRCFRAANGALPELKICEVAANIETCPSSEPGQNGYCYYCKAFNSLGESSKSNTACWKVPPAPTNVGITVP